MMIYKVTFQALFDKKKLKLQNKKLPFFIIDSQTKILFLYKTGRLDSNDVLNWKKITQ